MKKKELKDLHNQSTTALAGLIKKTQAELVKLKMDLQAGRLKNVHLVSQKRQNLARIKTILQEKELSQ